MGVATTLTRHQRAYLERRLEEERTLLSRALNRTVAEGAQADEQDRDGDLSTLPFHLADRGTDTMESELRASNATRMSRELADIDAALDRLHRSPERFGICEDTGQPIPFERLDVIPWARTCGQVGASHLE
jgi:RNA polymerase-binding transcription factor DksA